MLKLIIGALVLSGGLASAAVSAQSFEYHVYLNSDLRTVTGCTVTAADGQSLSGIDQRLTATVSGSPPVVSELRIANCAGIDFGAGSLIGGGYPMGLNNGVALGGGAFADVVELSVSRQLIPSALPMIAIGFGAQDGTVIDDGVFTRNGLPGGSPMAIGTAQLIPVAGFVGLVLLGAALLVLGAIAVRRNGPLTRVLLISACLAFSAAAWAANFILDGEVGDWSGIAPLATDQAGDSPLSGADIVAAFAVDDDPDLRFRIDVVDAENRPPVAVDDAFTVLEDQTLTVPAPGVLDNDSDPDGNAITAQLESGISSGTLQLDAAGGLTYSPVANENGDVTFTYTAFDGQVSSAPATATITITPVNDVPSFTVGADQTALEDAGAQTVTSWATAIGDGDPEVTQTLSFNITSNSNAALFRAGPAVAADGTLTFTPAADANGSATITLNLMDDGGTANGGVDTSADQTFTITVTAVNDAPGFTAGADQAVLEDAAAQTIAGWATAISAGPADESGQVLTFNAPFTATGNLSFTAPPAVAADGTLSYTVAPNTNGVATVSLTLMDDGGTANGGVDTSAPQTFTITVTAVNDAPSFTVGPNVTVAEDSGTQNTPWATAVSAGPANESAQALSFTVSNDNNALFLVQPTISAAGELRFTSAANAIGVATVTARLVDDGGTANGGVDSSAPQTFTITVTAANDPPVNTVPATASGNEDTAIVLAGGAVISVSDVDIGAGSLTVNLQVSNGSLTLTVSGGAIVTGNNSGAAQVSGPFAAVNGVLATLVYTPTANYNGSDALIVTANDNGNTGAGGPQSDSDTVAITVNPINDAPVNTVPGAQTVAGVALIFSTATTNAITVADVDANPGTVQVDLSVTAGALNAVVTPGVVITGNNTATVRLVGLQANVNTAMNGLGYVPTGVGTDTLTVLTSDLGNTGSGGPLTDSDTVTLLVDEAPRVTMVSPLNGATQQANNVSMTVTFSEQVNTLAGAVAVNCAPSGANASSTAQANVGSITLTGAAIGAANGDVCSVLVTAASVSDVDAIDPPDLMAANFNASYTIDLPPAFVSSTPAAGATVANNVVFTALFSEPVDFGMGGFTLVCNMANVPVTPSGSGTNTLTFTPTTPPLPSGSSCVATLFAANITDSDAGDPPNNLPADVVVNFTVDAAPAVTGSTPTDTATQVATDTNVSFDFSEAVNAGTGAITLNCGGNIAGVLSGSGGTTLTFNPSADLPVNTPCTATAVAAQISDVDAIDPPNLMLADVVRTFTTDAEPTVSSTLPATGATLQPPTGTITINFSESVNFSTVANAANTSFDLECPLATPANFTVVTASPATSVVLNPDDAAIAGQTCTLTVRAAGITDADAGDPPDTMAADVVVTIGYDDPAVANDDSYQVTPHLVLGINTGVQGGGVLTNDTVGSAVITGFGPIGTCAAVVPNGTNFVTTAGGGRVVLNLNGSFVYAPPAGLAGNGAPASPEDGFCYTLTGGNTANVGFELANTELVWFANAAYAGANGPANGTQARPHTNLPDIAAVDTASDTIHVAANAASYTGIQLESGTRLIGAGSASDLVTITGIAPVSGSAFPALGGTRPTVAGSGINLGSNNLIRGLNIGNTGGADGLNAAAGFGTFTMSEASILGTGRAMNLTGPGTLNVVLDELSSSGGFNGVITSGVGGTITVGAGGTNIGSTVGGDAIFVQLAPAGTNFNFGATAISSALGGVTSNVNNAGAVISFTSLAITTPTGPGLVANSGTINIAGVSNTINSTGGPALSVGGTNTGAGWTFSNLSSANSATQGIILDNITGGGITATGGSISGATGTAFLALNGFGGGVSYAGSISKTSAGRLVDISGAAGGGVTLAGNLSCTGSCGTGAGNHGLRVNGRTGGTISFSGASKTFSSSAANPGISLSGNTGATINFSGGGLAVASTSGTGFNATGGGTVTVQGTGNSISNTTGVALNVVGTTIGGAGLTFQSISSSGGANGIVLNNSGAGPLTVTGDGTTTAGILNRNGSGGVINADIGASLTNAQNVTLRQMNYINNADHAVLSSGGSNHILSAVTIQNPTNHGWEATNLAGVNRIDNGSLVTQFNGFAQDGVRLENTSTNFSTFTVDRTTFSSSSTGNDGFFHRALGTTTGAVVVSNSLFTGLDGDGVQVVNDGSGTTSATIRSNTFTTADATGGDGNNGIALNIGGSGILNFTVGGPALADGNVMTDLTRLGDNSGMINITAAGPASGGARIIGVVQRNDLSNTTGRRGVNVALEASGGAHGGHTISIDNNNINNIARQGIAIAAITVGSNDLLGNTVNIRNNTIGTTSVVGNTPSSAANAEGIDVRTAATTNGNIGLNVVIEDNAVVTNNTDETIQIDAANGTGNTAMNVTVHGNTITNNNVAGNSFEARAISATTLCLDLNSANIGADRNNANRGYELIQIGGTFGIENLVGGAAAFVAARNDGGPTIAPDTYVSCIIP